MDENHLRASSRCNGGSGKSYVNLLSQELMRQQMFLNITMLFYRIPLIGWVIVTLFLRGLPLLITAEQISDMHDTTYYIYPNFQNPLLSNEHDGFDPLYYNDAMNVLHDLSTFESLHVQFHSCVMVPSSIQQDDNADNGDENDVWYIGTMPIAEAQVSFSLYGIKKDTSQQNWFQRRISPSNCHRRTFINSFYTTTGMMSFINALAISGKIPSDFDADTIPSTSCHVEGDYGYGTVCSNNDRTMFAYNQYALAQSSSNGRTESICTHEYLLSTTDNMESINPFLHSSDLDCLKLYDMNSVYDDDTIVSDTAIQYLLSNSESCNVLYDPYNIGGQCPDPYRIIQHREQTLALAMIQDVTMMVPSIRQNQRKQRVKHVSIGIFIISGILLIVASILFLLQYQKAYGLRRRKRRQRRSRYRQQQVQKANEKWKRHQKQDGDEMKSQTSFDCNDIFDDTTSTIASSSTYEDEDHGDSAATSLQSLQTYLSKPNTALKYAVCAPSSTGSSPTNIGQYEQFHEETDAIEELTIGDRHVEKNYNTSPNRIECDKHASTSPTSTIERFRVSRMKFDSAKSPLYDDSTTCSGQVTENYPIETVVEEKTQKDSNQSNVTGQTQLGSNDSSSNSPPPTTSIFKHFTARRQRLTKLRKSKPSRLGERKYIPPSLLDPTVTKKEHKTMSVTLDEQMSEVQQVGIVLTNEPFAQCENDSSVSSEMQAADEVKVEKVAPSNNVQITDQSDLNNSDRKSNTESLARGILGTFLSPVNACMFADASCPSFAQLREETKDSILSDDDTLAGLNSEESVSSPCRSIAPEQLSKQLAATRYVKAIGETLVSSIENDPMKNSPTTSSTPIGVTEGPVNVQSFIVERIKNPRMSLPAPKMTMYQSHRSNDSKPVGLRSYASIRETNVDDKHEQDIVANKGDAWEAFDTMFEETKNPKFIRVPRVADTKTATDSKCTNIGSHSSNNPDHVIPLEESDHHPDGDEIDDQEYLDYEEDVDTVGTYYNDGDESFTLQYLAEIPFSTTPNR